MFAVGEKSEIKENDRVIKWHLLIMGFKLCKFN